MHGSLVSIPVPALAEGLLAEATLEGPSLEVYSVLVSCQLVSRDRFVADVANLSS